MLIEFSVGNFRSFKDVQTLSFVAAPIKSKYPELDKQNVFEAGDKLKLLKTVGMYGANGSGKSNLVKALRSFLAIIEFSFKNEKIGEKAVTPFLFNTDASQNKSFFQIVFKKEGTKYRYGFEIRGNVIESEWLFGTPLNNEVFFFTREFQNININKSQFSEGLGLEDKTKDSNLFLNVTHAFNGKISKIIKDFLMFSNIIINSGIEDEVFKNTSLKLLEDEVGRRKILGFLNDADIGIQDINNVELSIDKIAEKDFQTLDQHGDKAPKRLYSSRVVFNSEGQQSHYIFTNFEEFESKGTQMYFSLSSMIIVTLQAGCMLFLDEFDASLHPLLTKKIVELFNSPKSNPKNAQLFFVTHDTNLLDPKLLRRDQIYFAEKNSKGESSIYSLTDLNGVRNDASFEKDYIQGKYGAIPFLGGFNKLLGD